MSNNPLEYPKSKIPVPESPYLSASRSGYLADLSDQVFFDENVPTPVDPITKRPKSPPYSYGPPGILHDPSVQGPSSSPRRKSRRRRPPDITTSEYVDSRLEELLGPTATLDVDESVDDILDSIQRRGSRELRDSKGYTEHSRYPESRREAGRKRASPLSRSHEGGLGGTLSIADESERKARELLKGKSVGGGLDARLKESLGKSLSRPESRQSDHPSSRPPSDKPRPPVPSTSVTLASPKKSPAKLNLKGKDIDGKDGKTIISDATKVGLETRKKVQDNLVKSDMPAVTKAKGLAGQAAAAAVGGAVGGATVAAVKGKLSDSKEKGAGEKDGKEKSQKIGGDATGSNAAGGKGDKGEKGKGDGAATGKKETDAVAGTAVSKQPAFSGTDIYGHTVDLSKMDAAKKEEFLKDHAQGMKLLHLCHAADWYAVENQLKLFEKKVQNGAINYKPLQTVRDEVC